MVELLEEVIEQDETVLDTIASPVEDTTQRERYTKMCTQMYNLLAAESDLLKKIIKKSFKATKKARKKLKKNPKYQALQTRITMCYESKNTDEARQLQRECEAIIGTPYMLRLEHIANKMQQKIPGQTNEINTLFFKGDERFELDPEKLLPLYREQIFTQVGVQENEREVFNTVFEYACKLESNRYKRDYLIDVQDPAGIYLGGFGGVAPGIIAGLVFSSVGVGLGVGLGGLIGGFIGGLIIGNRHYDKKQKRIAKELFEGKKHEYVDELMKLEQW